MAMPYLASPLSLGNLQGVDYLNTMPGMDLPEQQSNFESEAFVRCVSPVLSSFVEAIFLELPIIPLPASPSLSLSPP